MWRVLFLLLTLTPASAVAQQVTCATRPAADNSNACASTAFVKLAPIPASNITFSYTGTGALSTTVDFILNHMPITANGFTGFDSTGATSSTAALQNALNSNNRQEIYVGPGTPLLTDMVTLNKGQTLRCAGKFATRFQVKYSSNAFNMNALGVFKLPDDGDSARIIDCGIEFEQPNTGGMTRADVIKYPPAIVAGTISAFVGLRDLRISAAWTCLSLVGNSGGAFFGGKIECGALADYSYANYTASASAGVLTVSAVASGAIRTQRNASYIWIAVYPQAYRIVSQLTGTPGGVGTYQLGSSISFASGQNYQTDGGIVIDGPGDFFHLGDVECWPFGIVGVTNLEAVYNTYGTNCAAIGYVTGFEINSLAIHKTGLHFTPRNAPFANIINKVQSDGSGADIINDAGTTRIGSFVTFMDSGQTNPIMQTTTALATIEVDSAVSTSDASVACAYQAGGGGTIRVNNGRFAHSNTTTPLACTGATVGSKLYFRNAQISMGGVNRTYPFFFQAANTSMALKGISKDFEGTGLTGAAFEFSNDNASNEVSESYFPNRGHTIPFNTSTGYYDLDEPDTIATPTVAFATPGSAITVNSSSGRFWRKGSYARLEAAVDFTTPAATTEAGALGITISNMPAPLAGSETGCVLNDASKVTFASQWFPFVAPSNPIRFRQLATGAASALMSTTEFPASTTNIITKFNCIYLVR